MKFKEIEDLHNICKIIGNLKSQMIPKLPHSGNEGLFFQNDEITTGQMNNTSEIKIHLLTGQLLFFHDEKGFFIDLTKDDVSNQLETITKMHDLVIPKIPLKKVPHNQLSKYYDFAIKAKRTIELFRMGLEGRFTQVHLWPHHFDFSVEWFTGKNDEQIGTGISPGDENYSQPYLYMNPYPFNPKITEMNLPIGTWHTSSWKGVKIEREDLGNYAQQEATDILHQLFLIVKKNFQ